MTGGPVRFLVTGSRDWDAPAVVEAALLDAWHERGRARTVLVHGGCPRGVDAYADALWRRMGQPVELHQADWGRYGQAAGPRRNAGMVAAGADLCLAFIRGGSPGASGTARMAGAAGIPVRVWRRP